MKILTLLGLVAMSVMLTSCDTSRAVARAVWPFGNKQVEEDPELTDAQRLEMLEEKYQILIEQMEEEQREREASGGGYGK